MKKFVSIFLVVLFMVSFPTTTYASENEVNSTSQEQVTAVDEYTDVWLPKTRWANISIITMAVTPNGTNVNASYDVQGYFTENTVRVSCSLQKFETGKWQTVASQYASGKFYCRNNFNGTISKGLLARLQLDIKVVDRNGNIIETFTTYSNVKSV